MRIATSEGVCVQESCFCDAHVGRWEWRWTDSLIESEVGAGREIQICN